MTGIETGVTSGLEQFNLENDRAGPVGAAGKNSSLFFHPREAAAETDVRDVPLDIGVRPGAESLRELRGVKDKLLSFFETRADGIAGRGYRRLVTKQLSGVETFDHSDLNFSH